MPSPVGRRLNDPGLSVRVTWATPQDEPAAREWARSLGLALSSAADKPQADLLLELDHGVLSIRDIRSRGLKPLSIELDAPASPSKKQLLGRAVGRRTRIVVDATAGWGEDARRLCAMGYAVTLVERNPVMAALLDNAAARASQAGRVSAPPQVVAGDAIDYLAAHPGAWDCVYLDPMFPPKRRASTLARRPMRLLRELAGDDPDRDRLFAAAVTAAARRVVVKRPDHHPPVFGEPGETVAGKLVCYDVYFI